MSNIDQKVEIVRGVLSAEREAGPRTNGLDEIQARKIRRNTINQLMEAIDAELQPIRQAIKGLLGLPPEEQIQWAQAISAMSATDAVRFLEVDTTGLTERDDIARVTLVNLSGDVFDDILMKPSRPMGEEASAANGLTDADLADAPSITDVWERRILRGLYGRYVISYNQKFDIEKLNEAATRYKLPPVTIIGDDLQRHARAYYHNEYYLTLEAICERVGHHIPSKSAVDRAKGQYHILRAMAEGVTDVRPPRPAAPAVSSSAASEPGDDGLADLDEHPF